MQKDLWKRIIQVYASALFLQTAIWFGLYKLAGYNQVSLFVAVFLTFLLGIFWLYYFQLAKQVGLELKKFFQAVTIFGVIHLIAFGIGLWLSIEKKGYQLFRDEYHLFALLENWIFTALGEQLLFSGVLFTLIRLTPLCRKPWMAVAITAGLFATWHFPGQVAMAISRGNVDLSMATHLLLNFLSWCFFGTIYLFSGNLWLTAMVHGSTDYSLLPFLIDFPVAQLFVMIVVIVVVKVIQMRKDNQLQTL